MLYHLPPQKLTTLKTYKPERQKEINFAKVTISCNTTVKDLQCK